LYHCPPAEVQPDESGSYAGQDDARLFF